MSQLLGEEGACLVNKSCSVVESTYCLKCLARLSILILILFYISIFLSLTSPDWFLRSFRTTCGVVSNTHSRL